ncbi:MAG: hypothetical protein AB1488_08620 [Nitrospirota bacterium]
MKRIAAILFFFSIVFGIYQCENAYGVEPYGGIGIHTSGHVHFIVTDPQGRRTGYNPILDKGFDEDPEASYSDISHGDDETGRPPEETSVEFGTNPGYALDGIYKIQVIGMKLGTYSLSVSLEQRDPHSRELISLEGVSDYGSTSSFEITFNNTPGQPLGVIRTATINSTKIDVETSYRVGWITNKGIMQSLLAKLDAAEQSIARGQKKTAANQLNAFINEVKAQSTVHIKPECSEMLIEDAEYILGHL